MKELNEIAAIKGLPLPDGSNFEVEDTLSDILKNAPSEEDLDWASSQKTTRDDLAAATAIMDMIDAGEFDSASSIVETLEKAVPYLKFVINKGRKEKAGE